jgi:hypothetical protein
LSPLAKNINDEPENALPVRLAKKVIVFPPKKIETL